MARQVLHKKFSRKFGELFGICKIIIIMKITRRQIRMLIKEAIRRVPLFPQVTGSELEQMRIQSRKDAGIDPEDLEKIEDLEMTFDSDNIAMGREFARALGSQRGEITEQEEEDFLRAQMIHRVLPVLEPIFGKDLYEFPPRLLELLQKFYETSQTASEFQVLLYDLGANEFVGDQKEITEDHESILKKLSTGSIPGAILRHAGPETGGLSSEEYYEMRRYLWKHYTPRQTPAHFVFRMAKHFRPDLKVYSAN